jgi:hypothetical protein
MSANSDSRLLGRPGQPPPPPLAELRRRIYPNRASSNRVGIEPAPESPSVSTPIQALVVLGSPIQSIGEAAERYLINHHLAAKGVQLRLVRQRVAMAVQKAQADVLVNRLHYALPRQDGRKGGAMRRRRTSTVRKKLAVRHCDSAWLSRMM